MKKQIISKGDSMQITLLMIIVFYPLMGIIMALSPYEDSLYINAIWINILSILILLVLVITKIYFLKNKALPAHGITVSNKTFNKTTNHQLLILMGMIILMYGLAFSVIMSFYAPLNYLIPAIINVIYVVFLAQKLKDYHIANPFDVFVVFSFKNKRIFSPMKQEPFTVYYIEQ